MREFISDTAANLAARILTRTIALASLCFIAFALSGCAIVGPSSISMGRADYNEAINRTEDEQMLLSIVKGRYGETFSLLAVTGVAANVRFASKAGVEMGLCIPNCFTMLSERSGPSALLLHRISGQNPS